MNAPFSGAEIRGVGVHSGREVRVRLSPGERGVGWRMVRQDLAGSPVVPIHPSSVVGSSLATSLGQGEATVQTTEHLLAALWGSGRRDVLIEVDGPEIPILDGSALPWVEALGCGGPPCIGAPREHPHQEQEGDAWVAVFPSRELRFSYGIDFPGLIGVQWASFAPEREVFASQMAPARTFILEEEAALLRAQGGLRGGDLGCALVLGRAGWLNPPLRFPDEPARHKLLDLIGDLALLGAIPRGHYVAYRAGHRLHGRLARALAG